MFGHDVYFDETNMPTEEAITALQEEIGSAFAVFGAYGTGPADEPLDPTFVSKEGRC